MRPLSAGSGRRFVLRLHFSAERDLDQLFGEGERGNPDEG